MSTDSLSNRKWPPLPLGHSDAPDDADFWADLIALRAITNQLAEFAQTAGCPVQDIDEEDSFELHTALALSQGNWPEDVAARLLANWRNDWQTLYAPLGGAW